MAVKFETRCALVIGAGIAGLAAAAGLSENFGRVVVIERDAIEDIPHLRKSLPQAGHMHALLQAGSDGLERLFPGFTTQMLAAGSLRLKVRSQWRTFNKGHWLPPLDTGVHVMSQTRTLLDYQIYERARRLPHVHCMTGKVTALVFDRAGAVVGVRLANDGMAEQILSADLVVDTTGRGDAGERWLEEAGRAAPPIESSFPDVRYVSAQFTRSAAEGVDPVGWLNLASPPETLGAVLAPVEQNRWIVTATIRDSAVVPTDETEFRAYLNSLTDGKIGQILTGETLLTGFRNYRIARVRLKRFDRMTEPLPAGYLPIGDAIASFNPIYAQGMSVAVMQAEVLKAALAATDPADGWQARLSRNYLAGAMVPASWAWLLSMASDMEFPNFKGDLSPEITALNRLLGRVFAISVRRPAIAQQVDRVVHLLMPPDSLNDILNDNSVRGDITHRQADPVQLERSTV